MECFRNRGFVSNGILHLTPSEAWQAIQEGALLVDVRPEFQVRMKTFAVQNIIFCPYERIREQFDLLPRQKPLILADAVGLRSKECISFLKEKGFVNISNLAGGITDWEKDGFPMSKELSQQLNGPCACMLRPKK